MYDWSDEKIEEYIASQGEDCNKIFYIEYSYSQIGLSEEWLKDISAKIGNKLTVRREILLQRLQGSSQSPFDREDLEYIIDISHKPIDELVILDYYKFDIYTPLQRDIPYIVGVDCSTGTNGDFNAITIIDPYTVEPVAEFKCNYVGETIYENIMKELVKILPRCVLCIERNSVGDGIIDHLMHSPIASRLYFDKNRDLMDDKMQSLQSVESMLKKEAEKKTYIGVYTTGHSREAMMAILMRHMAEFKEKFITQNITKDITNLIQKPSGKIEAASGSRIVKRLTINSFNCWEVEQPISSQDS